ncbi:unnamed protein product, partial [Prorocentrum cordatum]
GSALLPTSRAGPAMGSRASCEAKELDPDAVDADSVGAAADAHCLAVVDKAQLAEACEEYFGLFARSGGGYLTLAELRALVAAVCAAWCLEPPGAQDVSRAFERQRRAAEPGLTREGLAACAGGLLAALLAAHPGGLAAPRAEAVLAARGEVAARGLLHVELPARERPLRSIGVAGVAVVVSEVRCPPGERSALAREEELCCTAVVRREGLLLSRRTARTTASASRGSLSPEGGSRWVFHEELAFDDPVLTDRRGALSCTIQVRRRVGPMCRVLACAEQLPVPSHGRVVAPLVDPASGQRQGEVCFHAGWQCSDHLLQYVASDLVRRYVKAGRWDEARAILQDSGTDAALAVAAFPDSAGRTLLMWAARDPAGTKLLRDLLALSASAWLASDARGATAAHYAALSGSVEALAALLGCGLLPDAAAPGLAGATPLMLAALRGSEEHVLLLLGHGARADRLGDHGASAATWALCGGGMGPRCVGGPAAGCDAVDSWLQAAALPLPQAGAAQVSEAQITRVLALLVPELWSAAPPAALPTAPLGAACVADHALHRVWMSVMEVAAERQPDELLRWLLSDCMKRCCESEAMFNDLLSRVFDAALVRRSETLAARLVCEMRQPEGLTSDGAATSGRGQRVLEAAVDAQMPRLALALIQSERPPQLGEPECAVRVLRLAARGGHEGLMLTTLMRLPAEWRRDSWTEPATPGDGQRASECPACCGPLCDAPRSLRLQPESEGDEPPLACPHFVCGSCVDRLGGRCPLCRADFVEARALPDPAEDPTSWFFFAAGLADPAAWAVFAARRGVGSEGTFLSDRSQSPGSSVLSRSSSSASGGGNAPSWRPEHARSRAATQPSSLPATRGTQAAPAAAATQPAAGGAVEAYISRHDLERVLGATLPLDPQLLSRALDDGLWARWDVDGDGRVSEGDFLDPEGGLLRWLLPHVYELRAVPLSSATEHQLTADRVEWFRLAAGCAPGASHGGPDRIGGAMSRGGALRALLRLARVSSLDHAQVEEARHWISQGWARWDPEGTGEVHVDAFAREGGMADDLLEHLRSTSARRVTRGLAQDGQTPGKHVENLVQLCCYAAGLGGQPHSAGGADGAKEQLRSCAGLCTAARECAQRRWAGMPSAADQTEEFLYVEALPLVMTTMRQHACRCQVVGWACRVLVLLALRLCEAPAAASRPDLWSAFAEVAFDGRGAAALAVRAGIGGVVELSAQVVQPMAALCASPSAAADMAFYDTAAVAALLLRILAGPSHAEEVLGMLARLSPEASTPASRTFSCMVACMMLCDGPGVARQLEALGHHGLPVWSPAAALSPSGVSRGQRVEVCCRGGWHEGTVERPPLQEPSQPRDELWVVDCGPVG